MSNFTQREHFEVCQVRNEITWQHYTSAQMLKRCSPSVQGPYCIKTYPHPRLAMKRQELPDVNLVAVTFLQINAASHSF